MQHAGGSINLNGSLLLGKDKDHYAAAKLLLKTLM